jgi:HdeA/HdeB family
MDNALLRGLALCSALALAACQGPGSAAAIAAAPAEPSATLSLDAARKVELSAVTCKQVLENPNLLVATLTWADGYAHGRIRQQRTTGREITDHKAELIAECESDLTQRVVAVVERINRRTRR